MSQKLNVIYENIEVLVQENNYMVLPNETPRFFKALADARILSFDRIMVAWDILTYKHDEKNPFPSHVLLAKSFNVGVRAITNAVTDIVEAKLFLNEKGKYGTDKRKNTYNVSPLLNLLGCFVEAVREGREVCIKTLYKDVIEGRMSAKTVSTQVEEPKKEEVVVSEAINEALKNVSESHRQALHNIINKHVSRLDEETIIFYINRVEEKCTSEAKYYSFASTCFKNANNGDKEKEEQTPKEEAKKPYKGYTKPSDHDIVPDWLVASKQRDKENAERFAELKAKYGDVRILFEEAIGEACYQEKEYIIHEARLHEWYAEEIKKYSSREEMVAANEAMQQLRKEELIAKLNEPQVIRHAK